MAYLKVDRCGHGDARAIFMKNMGGKFKCCGYVCLECKVITITGGFKNHCYVRPLVFTLKQELRSGKKWVEK